MKKILSIVLSLTLALSAAAVAGISVSAEENYDYYAVVDPKSDSLVYDFTSADNLLFRKDGLSRASIRANASIDKENGVIKFERTTRTDAPTNINYYDSANMAKLAKDSVGFRVWVQAANEMCDTDNNILAFGFDSLIDDTRYIYATTSSTGCYLDKITTEGAWVTYMWGSNTLSGGVDNGLSGNYGTAGTGTTGLVLYWPTYNRFQANNGEGSASSINEEFLAGLQGIFLNFNDVNAANAGSIYNIGEWQFIYPEGKAPTGGSSVAEPTVTMLDGAAMRIDGATEGIRFSATVKTDDLVALKDSGATITDFGMLVAQKDSNPTEENMTVDNSTESTAGSVAESASVVAAKYKGTMPIEDAASGLTEIVGSLVEIKTDNANKEYVARAYIEYTLEGDENPHYVYSNISAARSLAYVAKQIKSGAGDDPNYYSSLCAEHRAVVDTWAGRYSA